MPPRGRSLAAVGGAQPGTHMQPGAACGSAPSLREAARGGRGRPRQGHAAGEGQAGAQAEAPALMSQAVSALHFHK